MDIFPFNGMPNFQLKTYQPNFLEEQEKIGMEATMNWKNYFQTPATTLKITYAQPDFDPETRHYAFDGDKMVGFLTSNIIKNGKNKILKANLEFPLVLPGYEEAEELLFKKAIETLKKKNVQLVQTRAGDLWVGTLEKALKWEYKFSSDYYIVMEAKAKEIIIEKIKDYDITDYDPNKDLNELMEIFENKLNWPKEQITSNLETIFQNKESYPIHLIIREKGKIVSRVLIYRDPKNPKELSFGTLILENEKYLNSIMFEIVERIKGLSVETISIILWNEIFTMEQKFKSFGFYRKGKISYYEKEI